ncbi:MAG: SDR family oxidoreductase [Candidatus Saelkia tenebricola]|nr:SDR family oxidoreductase [Candidatus Saelkia tenebricola]
MANWIVTGGAGFIGSHIVGELLKRGESVKVIDNFLTGKRENLDFPSEDSSKLNILQGDICDIEFLKENFKNSDYVLHQAALRSVPKSFHDPAAYDKVNVGGTLNVLIAARDCRVKRVVFASSSSVYGERSDLPERETDSTNPVSIYAATKLNGEVYCNVFSALYGLETVVLRYFNVFGPRQSLENQYAVVIPKFITSLLKKESPPVYGDGHQSRDFTYVKSVVNANILAALTENARGVFNVANGKSHTVLELFEYIKRYLNVDLNPRFESHRPGDVLHTLADITKASSVLGYEVKVDFEQGLTETIEWFKNNLEKL